MFKPTTITWIIAIFGAITFIPLMAVQLMMIFKPNSQKTKDLIIGKGEGWRDKSHFKYSLAFAWADWLVIFPLLILSYYGVFSGQNWGYILWITLGAISVYFSITFWVLEKEHALPSVGALAYFTFIWGFFLYWGVVAILYSFLVLL